MQATPSPFPELPVESPPAPIVWTRWMVLKCIIAVGMTAANISGGVLFFEVVHNPEGRMSQWFHDSWIKATVEKIWYRILGADDDT